MDDTVFKRFGGHRAVARMVLAFYDRVLQSERLAPFFSDIDMRRLVDHQAKFISAVMGGPGAQSDRELLSAHAHLAITDDDFAELVRLLEESLREFGLSEADLTEVMATIRAKRRWVVQGEPVAGLR